MSKPITYWEMTDRGSECWYVTTDPSYAQWSNTLRPWQGERMRPGEWPDPPVLLVYDSYKVIVDMPGKVGFPVVSGKMRRILEEFAPDAAEYLPIRLKGPGSDSLPDTYWAMNWLSIVDCLDERSFNVDRKGKRYVEVPVIDPKKIPPEFVLGVLEHYRVQILLRNDLRLALNKAGIRGTQFYKVASINRPESITWKNVDWSKADEDEARPPSPPRPPKKRVPPRPKRGK